MKSQEVDIDHVKQRRASSYLDVSKGASLVQKPVDAVKFGPKDFELLEFVGEVRELDSVDVVQLSFRVRMERC